MRQMLRLLKQKKRNPNNYTMGEHLRELKRRIISVFLVFLVVFILCYAFSDRILEYLLKLGKSAGYRFVYLAPQEILVQQLRLAGTIAAVATSPIIIVQSALFVSPALNIKHLLLKLTALMSVGYVLFACGGLFSYKVLIPFVYATLYQIGEASQITASVSVENYLTLFITIIMCLGIAFETPLCCICLTRVGVLSSDTMRRIRPFMIIVIFIFAALVTPPDVLSQCVVAVPLLVLYQLSIVVCKFIQRKD